jgi:hypothetical protein
MDFMNLLKSVEALLYEVVSWLVFYPLTLLRCLRHPLKMMDEAQTELARPPQEQFADGLSPPIFLFLTIVLAHGIDLGFSARTVALGGIFADPRNLLIFRAVAFSLLPLLLAVQAVRAPGQRLTRTTLRPAFYSQCLVAAPFVLSLDLAMTVGHRSSVFAGWLGGAIFLCGLLWYMAVLTEWFALDHRTRRHRAFGRALLSVLVGALALLAVLLLVGISTGIARLD